MRKTAAPVYIVMVPGNTTTILSVAGVWAYGSAATKTPPIPHISIYHERAGTSAFYEAEIHRVTQRFGNVAHVWSTYAWRRSDGGPVEGRGINSIQLYHDGTRWWITAWIFDSERADNPIPPAFLPAGE